MNDRKIILVAEENRKINRLVSYFLLKAGFDVINAYDGRAALKAVEEKVVDAAIIETMLPFLDGLQVLRRIRQSNPYLPVLMTSLKIREADRQQSLELGANDFITKPFELKQLIESLNTIMGEQQ